MNILFLAALIFAMFMLFVNIIKYLKYKLSVEYFRTVLQAILFIACIAEIMSGYKDLASLHVLAMLIIYISNSQSDKYNVRTYCNGQKCLDFLNNAGWGNTELANEVKTIMGESWNELPKSCKEKILEWEKTLDKPETVC